MKEAAKEKVKYFLLGILFALVCMGIVLAVRFWPRQQYAVQAHIFYQGAAYVRESADTYSFSALKDGLNWDGTVLYLVEGNQSCTENYQTNVETYLGGQLFVEADGTGEAIYLRPYQNGGWDTDTLIRLERRER